MQRVGAKPLQSRRNCYSRLQCQTRLRPACRQSRGPTQRQRHPECWATGLLQDCYRTAIGLLRKPRTTEPYEAANGQRAEQRPRSEAEQAPKQSAFHIKPADISQSPHVDCSLLASSCRALVCYVSQVPLSALDMRDLCEL